MPATKGRPDGTPEDGAAAPGARTTPTGDATPTAATSVDDKRAQAMAARARQEEKEARRKERGRPRTPETPGLPTPSPRWWAPLMVTLMVIGLMWVVVFYISGQQWPIASLGPWNILVGFVFIITGFLMTMRWT